MMLTKSPPLAYGVAPRVNLLPPAERERRDRDALTRRWAGIAAAAAGVVVLALLGMVLLEQSARSGLADEQQRTDVLTRELATYHEVSTATRDKTGYEAYRAQVMGTDLSWTGLFGALRAQVPGAASITGFDVATAIPDAPGTGSTASPAPTGSPVGGAGTTSADGSMPAAAPVGTAVTVTLTVTSKRPLDQQAVVTGLEKVPGVLDVELGGISSEQYPAYSATSVVYLDDSVYSGRYARSSR